MNDNIQSFLSKNRVYILDLETRGWKVNPEFDSSIVDAVYTDKMGRKMMLSHLQNINEKDYMGALGVGKNIKYQGKNGKMVFVLKNGKIGKSSIISKITPDFSNGDALEDNMVGDMVIEKDDEFEINDKEWELGG